MKFLRKKVLSDHNQNELSKKSCVNFKRDDIKKFQKDTIEMLRQGMRICDKLESSLDNNELISACDDLFFKDASLTKKLDECVFESKGIESDGFCAVFFNNVYNSSNFGHNFNDKKKKCFQKFQALLNHVVR